MIYSCWNCRYIYDESLWDEKEWISQWTLFSELWYDWICPICWWEQELFIEIKEEVLTADDIDNMTDLELSHMPKLTVDEWKLLVEIGYDEHPMVEWHYISVISLLDEYWDIVSEEFLDLWKKPEIIFDISDLDMYEVRVKCNSHWLWTSWLIENS